MWSQHSMSSGSIFLMREFIGPSLDVPNPANRSIDLSLAGPRWLCPCRLRLLSLLYLWSVPNVSFSDQFLVSVFVAGERIASNLILPRGSIPQLFVLGSWRKPLLKVPMWHKYFNFLSGSWRKPILVSFPAEFLP